MKDLKTQDDPTAARLAAVVWLAAAVLYVGIERAAAFAFSTPYSYADNYISDLGVNVCGAIFDGRAICSPLHGLMNANFVLQGVLFLIAALAIAQSISNPLKFVFLAFAALNGIGNGLVGLVPETATPPATDAVNYHVLGAFLAIVFGNGAALISALIFRELGLARIHRKASIVLPLLAAVALVMLLMARGSETIAMVPDGVWERISVYTITGWEALSAVCVLGWIRGR